MTESPSVRTERIEGAETVILREPATDAVVQVVTGVGSNLTRFSKRVGERVVEAIASPPSIETLRERPSRWGSCVLFPYPGRVSGGRFTFRGREIVLPKNQGGETIHGVVRNRPWRVVASGAGPGEGAWVASEISTAAERIPPSEWPFPFTLGLRFGLRDGVVRVDAVVTNDGAEPMPMGLGFHPYFPTPLGPRGQDEACEVWVDATELWERVAQPPAVVTTLGAAEDPRRPRSLADIPTRPAAEGPVRNLTYRRDADGAPGGPGGISAGLRDPDNGLGVTLTASAGFGALVFFTPTSPPVVSLEPHTCLPNALNLVNDGHARTGLVVLDPRERWRGWFELRVDPL